MAGATVVVVVVAGAVVVVGAAVVVGAGTVVGAEPSSDAVAGAGSWRGAGADVLASARPPTTPLTMSATAAVPTAARKDRFPTATILRISGGNVTHRVALRSTESAHRPPISCAP